MTRSSEFNHRKKQRIIYIMGGKCALCGYNRCDAALEMHHIDQDTKEFSFSQMNHYLSIQDMQTEMKKCILLCSNCHKEIHYSINNIVLKTSFDEEKYNEIITEINKRKFPKIKYCSNCGIEISSRATLCIKCNSAIKRNTNWPTKMELKNLIRNYSFTSISKIYGVSDNSIRNWCKYYNLPYKKIDIMNISDDMWNLL